MPRSPTFSPWRSSALVIGVAIALVLAPASAGAAHTTAAANDGSPVGPVKLAPHSGSGAGGNCEGIEWVTDVSFKVHQDRESDLTVHLAASWETTDKKIDELEEETRQLIRGPEGAVRVNHTHLFTNNHVGLEPTTVLDVDVEGEGQVKTTFNDNTATLQFSEPGRYQITQLRLTVRILEFLEQVPRYGHTHEGDEKTYGGLDVPTRTHEVTCVFRPSPPRTVDVCEDPSELEQSMLGLSQRQQDARTEARAAGQQYRDQQEETGVMGGGPLPNPGTAAQDIETSVASEREYVGQLKSSLETVETLGQSYNDIQQSAAECGCDGQAGNNAPDGGTTRETVQNRNEELPTDISEDKGLEAVAEALRERGLRPPSGTDLTLKDYLIPSVDKATRGQTVTGSRSISARLGPNGNLLPKHKEALKRARYDGDIKGSLQGATHWLDIDIHKISEGDFDVQVNLIDVETGKIQESHYSGWNEPNADLANVVNEALGNVEGRLGEPTDGRVPDDQRVCGGTTGGGS